MFEALLGVCPPSVIQSIDRLIANGGLPLDEDAIASLIASKVRKLSLPARPAELLLQLVPKVASGVFRLHSALAIPSTLVAREVRVNGTRAVNKRPPSFESLEALTT